VHVGLPLNKLPEAIQAENWGGEGVRRGGGERRRTTWGKKKGKKKQ